jgi:hypothetical protein
MEVISTSPQSNRNKLIVDTVAKFLSTTHIVTQHQIGALFQDSEFAVMIIFPTRCEKENSTNIHPSGCNLCMLSNEIKPHPTELKQHFPKK